MRDNVNMPVTRHSAWPEFSERLFVARRRSKLTQAELAEELGCDRSTICKLEQGYTGCTAKMAKQIADILQVPLSWLMGGRT